jgi:hypothetical protein
MAVSLPGRFRLFYLGAKEAKEAPVDLTKVMLLTLDDEIERVKTVERLALSDAQRRQQLQMIAASVPSHNVSERFMHYHTHLARKYDRICSQLERRQQLRLGQPSAPAVRVELSD